MSEKECYNEYLKWKFDQYLSFTTCQQNASLLGFFFCKKITDDSFPRVIGHLFLCVQEGKGWYSVTQNFCGSLFLWIGNFLWFLRLGQIIWFFLPGINFCDFLRCTQYPVLIILFWFLLSAWNRNTYFQVIYQCVVISEWKRQVVIEQARFLSTVFLCRKFKLENINSEIKFCTKNVCGNFYLRELLFVDHWKNCKNRKI